MQLVSRQFNGIIASASQNNFPLRFMHSVVVKEDGSVIVHLDKSLKKLKLFPTFDELLAAKNQQNTGFLHICIYSNHRAMEEVYLKHNSLVVPSHSEISEFFFSHEPISTLPPEIYNSSITMHSDDYYVLSFNTRCFMSWMLEINLTQETNEINQLPPIELVKWLEFNNRGCSSVQPKRFKKNVFGIGDSPKAFIDIMFQRFEQQRETCQFEIIFVSLGSIHDPNLLPIHKSVKNYATNEILESIVMSESTEANSNPDYIGVAWVLRRRSLTKEWTPWWSLEENTNKLCDWLHYVTIIKGEPLYSIRYASQE